MNPRRHPESFGVRTAGTAWLGLMLFAAGLTAQTAYVGLSAVRAQRFENENLTLYFPEEDDRFALALASGDFNGDGADDLATGMPYDDGLAGSGLADSGTVVIRYGIFRAGLATGLAAHVLSQGSSGSPDPAEEGDFFGWALASCDWNGDGFDDLAVGIPSEDEPGHPAAGAVQIFYGSLSGISNGGIAFYTQDTPGIPDGVEAEDAFGEALACGDFNGDGFGDLAIGAKSEDAGALNASGYVAFIPGSAAGTRPDLATALDQDSPGMFGSAEVTDYFGDTLAVGDFDGDGFDDVAIGVPWDAFGVTKTGAVHVVRGGASGITSAGNVYFFESSLGGAPEVSDQFGEALAAGDFDSDGFDDLAIGVPGEDLGALTDTGNVGVAYGDPTGFFFGRSQGFDQDSLFGLGNTESGDGFGTALATGDFDGDGRDDLAIGHPFETITGGFDGAVSVLMGSPILGLSLARTRLFISGFLGIPGNLDEHSKTFGLTLAGGDFDGNGYGDLAIGMPHADVNSRTDVGAEIVLYGALFADGFATDVAVYWSAIVP